jgi:hypothetical protein
MLAEEGTKEYSRVVKEAEMGLLKHKIAMLLDGSNVAHGHDNFEWSSAAVSSRAQFTKYEHKCGVFVTLRNIEMKR